MLNDKHKCNSNSKKIIPSEPMHVLKAKFYVVLKWDWDTCFHVSDDQR